ncbi:hypothetical protein [Stigmatella aurantiaca]|uniref:Carbohydrate-binding protein n=1 Tax=Stigmatella aurantiaca (strain DW4/3-1) TaxID=378806 RepID=Q099D0_STIAD|nr:hypothetical protein [Stigmatella aurantiaca]EAU68357.1 hypothetical protein STIAU_3934 [Stigmatella aurantiaca DW4/3-1]
MERQTQGGGSRLRPQGWTAWFVVLWLALTPSARAQPQDGPGSTGILPPILVIVDPFGVAMIHPTRLGGETWFLSNNPLGDPRFEPQHPITRNPDGSWKIRHNEVRLSVFTSTGYNQSRIASYDRDVLARQGYMQAPNDWKNVEMTGYVRLNQAQSLDDNFSWYARGGQHTGGEECEGSAYKGALHYDGRVRWQKEMWHVRYAQSRFSQLAELKRGEWVGFKAIMRNTPDGRVRLQLWVDEDANKLTWREVEDIYDQGDWGEDSMPCPGSSAKMPITWGGPIAVFRWDNAPDVDFKWLSVREIWP